MEKMSGRLQNWIVVGLAALKLGLHLATASNYGLFVDELYFLETGRNLAWGYVDMPPLTALQGWLAGTLFGQSVWGIHLLPALLGAGLVGLTGWMVAELGGKAFAQALAGISVLIAGGFLAANSYLSMNSVEPLVWLGCMLVLVKMARTGNPRLWLAFGGLAGAGLMNKHTMLVFGLAVVLGMLLTPARRWLWSPWFAAGGGLALLIFLPNLVWNIQQGFPMYELQVNARASGRNVDLSLLQFLSDLVIFLQPLTLPVWLGGLAWFLFHPRGRGYAFAGWAFLISLAILLAVDGRTYYLLPAFPALLAGGAVGLEGWLASSRLGWLRVGLVGLLGLGGAATAPLFAPVLPPEVYITYSQALGIRQPRLETYRESLLPQLFADRFGWPEMAETVAGVYQSLSPEDQARAVVLTGNYGQAGAIDLYGPALGLPGAISGHQNYSLWGTRGYSGEVVIAIGVRPELLRRFYAQVEYVDETYHPYAMPYENTPIYVCREPKQPLDEVWGEFKHWD